MLAPIDKQERTGGNNIIQVVITRRCDIFHCTNCTQLLPFRTDVGEMRLPCVEEALESLRDWPGIVACFGGNPLTHTRFADIAALWERIIPAAHRGLWTNNLREHGAVVRRVWEPGVATFNLNVHGDQRAAEEMRKWLPGVPVWGTKPSRHGAILADYRDYGRTEEEWVAARESCDINQNWSGAVYERKGRAHAYFCEVAGAIDGVRGENHGVPVEPGWWRWRMDRFEHQVGACCDRGCGVPLRLAGGMDNERLYHISPSWVGSLRESKSVTMVVQSAEGPKSRELTDYAGLRDGAPAKRS